jgi:hypothetical protein
MAAACSRGCQRYWQADKDQAIGTKVRGIGKELASTSLDALLKNSFLFHS